MKVQVGVTGSSNLHYVKNVLGSCCKLLNKNYIKVKQCTMIWNVKDIDKIQKECLLTTGPRLFRYIN